MNDTIRAVILGIIEGLTEFIPVSSTGHLIVAMPWLNIEPADRPLWDVFLYFVQIGAILAVMLYFQRPLRRMLFQPLDGRFADHLAVKLIVAFVPSAVVGVLLNDLMEKYLESDVPVAIALIAGAGLMEWIERGRREGPTEEIEQITLRQSLLIGVAQCVSIVPGTSRSMATIMGGLLVGLRPAVAAEFSFFLAIPTLVAAGGYRLFKHADQLHMEHAQTLAVGFVTALAVAWLVVDLFMRFVRRHRLRVFAVYRVVLGVAILVAHAARN